MVAESFNRAGADIVQQYVEQVIDFVQANSLLPLVDSKGTAHLDKFAADLRSATKGATAYAQTYPALHDGMMFLQSHDDHSGFRDPDSWQELMDMDEALPDGRIIGDVAYLRVPGYSLKCEPSEDNFIASHPYVVHLQQLIANLDCHDPKGWVLDLRSNTGGSSWPMLAGLGPLWEGVERKADGHLGSFVTRQGQEPWGCKDGAAWNTTPDGDIYISAGLPDGQPSYHLKKPNSLVAVLMGPQTMSAGETQAVAALGCKPRMKIFGADSAGMTTGNAILTGSLHDAAKIILASSTYADATGRRYGFTLSPDVYVAESGPNDPVPQQALDWIAQGGPATRLSTKPFLQP